MGSSSPAPAVVAAAAASNGGGGGVAPPPAASNFSDFVQRFAWACLLRPGGVKMALKNDENGDGDGGGAWSDSEEWPGNRNTRESMRDGGDRGERGGAKLSSNGKSKSSSFKEAKEEEMEDSFHEAEWESGTTAASVASAVRIQALENALADVFATVSALKSAYIQLQAAHSPFDPEKLRLADKAVILELRRLSEMKHGFREQQRVSMAGRIVGASLEEQNEELRRKIQELQASGNIKQRAVETYEARVRACESEMEQQKLEIEELSESLDRALARRDKLERRLRKLEQRSSSSSSSAPPPQQHQHQHQHHQHQHQHQQHRALPILENGSMLDAAAPSVQLFEWAIENARDSALGFGKLLVSLMRGVQWDLEAAAESIEPGITYARPAHRRFAFESYVCHRMFCGFENENFYINGSLSSILDPVKHRGECFLQFRDMRAVDPADLLGITPECLFGKFCHRKFLQIVHEKMEESFFGGLEQHRQVILAGGHPRTRFYHSFLRFAKAVWLVHRLAFSFDPTASIFQVKRGTEFDPVFMDSAARNVRMSDDDESVRPRVGFTVMPGFRVDKRIVKCHVYLDGMVASSD